MDEIAAAQERLREALGASVASVDRELPAKVNASGEVLVRTLHGLLRLSRTHAPDNQAFDAPVEEFRAALGRLLDLLGPVSLAAVDDMLYCNDLRLKFRQAAEVGTELCAELQRHRIGGISFQGELEGAHVRCLMTALAASPDPNRPRTTVRAALDAGGVAGVALSGPYRYKLTGETVSRPEARKVAARVTELLDKSFRDLASDRLPAPAPMRRLVASIVEVGPGAEGLWDEPDGSSPPALHTMRVCQLSLLLGTALGLPPAQLQDLGLAAMMHDIGYTAREGAVMDSRGVSSGGYAPPFERHPAAGARLMLRQRGFSDAKVRRLLCCLHHHRPWNEPGGTPHLFARIVHIADDYDTFVSPRGAGLPPRIAIGHISFGAGSTYDPVLARLFVNCLGAYPPGTLLQLADGRVVCSASGVRRPDLFRQPRCFLVRSADGTEPTERVWVDLGEEGQVTRVMR